ncbi:hypothetical protein FWK35_00006879, partial [Aphis craccivora]
MYIVYRYMNNLCKIFDKIIKNFNLRIIFL